MQIYEQENVIWAVKDFIEKKYEYKKVAFFVDDNEKNSDLMNVLASSIKNKVIFNKPLSEDVAFCVICGNYEFQQESLKIITKNKLPYGYAITNLSQSSFILPYIQSEKLIPIYSPEFIAFEQVHIKEQAFCNNLAVISFLQSRTLSLFEKEYYAKIFNKSYCLDCKQTAINICDEIKGIRELKYKNVQAANIKVLKTIIKYLKVQEKYDFLIKADTVTNFATELTKYVFKNFYENMFIACFFETNLLEQYFSLSFENSYIFNFEHNLKYCDNDFNKSVSDFQKSLITSDFKYKIKTNKNYFVGELLKIKTNLFLKKYDNLCIFDDFGYKLVKILQNFDIKATVLTVANHNEETLFKQIRNVGLLD